MTHRWKRRDFLRHSALGSLLAPVVAAFPDLAEAQIRKTYMVNIFLPNGKCAKNVFITPTAGSSGWTFGPGFQPYERFRDDAIVFNQYSFQGFVNKLYTGDHGGHHADALCMFSGDLPFVLNAVGRGSLAPTIDQIVAFDYMKRGIVKDPLSKSLNIRMPGSAFKVESVFYQTPADYALGKTYTTEQRPVTNLKTPDEGFKRLFSNTAALAGGSPTVEKLWKFGRSVLDAPTAELKTLGPTLPAEGKTIVDEHLQALRELEASLALENQQTFDPTLKPPAAPPTIAWTADNHVALFSNWVKLIDAAFRFDLTRIATVQFGGGASRFRVPSLGLGFVGMQGDSNSGDDHHSYTHWKEDQVDLFLKWFADRIVELLGALKGEGTPARPNILKDSAVMVGCEFGRNHDARDVPVMIFGQAGGYFKTGRMITYANDISAYHKHTGTLLAMCHAMGVTGLTAVGNPAPEYQRGPALELRG